jgi:chemotaxis response regulator CheB
VTDRNFQLIGIGVGEGGIEPLREILLLLPGEQNAAIFVLRHLPPDFPSFTAQVLQHHTSMTIVEAADRTIVKPGHLYCLPVNHYMTCFNGTLRLETREPKTKTNQAIDKFFNSLAKNAAGRAIAILLSGNGNDGVQGLLNVAVAGGITIVQDPETALYSKAPKAEVAAGAAIFNLKPRGIADLLTELVKPQ